MFNRDNALNNEEDLSGIYIASVIENKDPKAQERVLVRVIGLHDFTVKSLDNAIWAKHLAPMRNISGEIPHIGDHVYVQFVKNNPLDCLWLGYARSSYEVEEESNG